jgi:hypothetical protein
VLRRIARRLFLVLVATAALAFGARVAARSFLFPTQDLRVLALPPELVETATRASDGTRVRMLELPAPAGAPTVVHFHANRETVEGVADFARRLHAAGLGVLLAEYRGYGASRDGSPSEEGLYADGEAALDVLAARGIGPARVILSGTSLGTGVAAEMARRGRGSRLVLVAPYTSIPDLVTDVAPLLPARWLVPDHFDTLAKAASIRVPTLVVHGDADEIVPFWMGERLASAIAVARLVRVPGGRHGDLLARDGAHIVAEIAALATR